MIEELEALRIRAAEEELTTDDVIDIIRQMAFDNSFEGYGN